MKFDASIDLTGQDIKDLGDIKSLRDYLGAPNLAVLFANYLRSLPGYASSGVVLTGALSWAKAGTEASVEISKAQIIADGDSLDRGAYTSNEATKNWPVQMALDAALFGPPLIVAVSGQSTSDMLNRQAQYVLAAIDRVAYSQVIISVGGGHNDLMGGVSPADIKANILQYIQNIRAWQAAHDNFPVTVILLTLTVNGKQYGSITLADYETKRVAINAERKSGYASMYGADACNDYDSDARLLDCTNTTYFAPDKQHFIDEGQLVRANLNKPLFIAAQAGKLSLASARRVFYADLGVRTASGFSWADQSGNGDVLSTASTSGAWLLANALNNRAAVRLASTPLLGTVPGKLSGSAPFQFLAVIRLAAVDNLSLLGYGTDDEGGAIADMIAFNGLICMHTCGNKIPAGTNSENSPVAPATPAIGTFGIVGIRYDGTSATSYTNATGLSEPYPIYRAGQADSVLTVGGGHYQNTPGSDFYEGTCDFAAVIINEYDTDTWQADLVALQERYAL